MGVCYVKLYFVFKAIDLNDLSFSIKAIVDLALKT